MHIVICEDRAQDTDQLARDLERFAESQGIKLDLDCFSRPSDMLAHMRRHGAPQVSFLDIYMDEMSGVELARRIHAQDERAAIIFVTASADHRGDGFEVGALHYLMKPYTDEQLAQAMRRAMLLQGEPQRALALTVSRQVVPVAFDQIAYIEALDKHCHVFTAAGEELISRIQLAEIMQQLSGDARFLNCHRSFVVNMDHVARQERCDFIMKGGQRIPIRAKQRAEIVDRYAAHWFARARRI